MSVPILEKIRSTDNLPSLPVVALEVLRLTRSDNASAAEIAQAIEYDPALASKILKVANSSLFGMPRQISSLRQAMTILGLRTVKVMALTFSLADAMQGKVPGAFDYQLFWRRSLTNAVAARLLAEHIHCPQPDEVFVTALLCDVGMLAAFHADDATYRALLAEFESSHQQIHALEQRFFGADHQLFSSHLLDTWGLPERMVKAVASHHAPLEEIRNTAPEDHLVRVVVAAGMIGEVFCSPGGAALLHQVTVQIPEILPVSQVSLHGMLQLLHKQVQETASKWAIDIGVARSYKEIQAEAVVELAKLTMAAELERAQLAVREQQLHVENKDLARKASTDGLTGIANRLAMEQHLQEVCGKVVAEDRTVGMLLLDIDRFKKLNDTFGHQVGDTALRLLGDRLRQLNDSNIFTARYGGEEFAIIVLDTPLNQLRGLAEKIRMEIQQIRIPFKDRQIAITVSIGGAVIEKTSPDPSPAGLIALADKFLYQAKETGRNRAICGEAAPATARPATAAPAIATRPLTASAR